MSIPLNIMFLDSKRLEIPQTLKQVVQVFLGAGFRIDALDLGGTIFTWEQYTRKTEEAISLAFKTQGLSFRAFNPQRGLEVRQQVAWGAQRLGNTKRAWIRTITDNTPYFWHSEYDPPSYSFFFLDLGISLYHVLQPAFGWIDFDYGLFTTHDDIESLKLPALYWANLFGPAYVSQIGEGKILEAPAWKVKKLDDGGLAYMLASCPGLATDHVPVAQVRSYFSVDKVR